MRSAILLIALALLAAGCQSAPSAGMAGLRLKIIAEPKTGAAADNTHVLEYDAPVTAAGAYERVDYDNLDDIVVWLEPATAGKLDERDVDIDGATSVYGLTGAVSVGQTINFHNTGSTKANVYSVSDGNQFDFGSMMPGAFAQYTVRSPGLIEVLTDSQKGPVALVYAAPTALVRVAHAGETVSFNDLRPGEYVVHSWHPRLPGHEMRVNLLADRVSDAAIKVGVNGLPTVEPR
jgi:hypothetical protein